MPCLLLTAVGNTWWLSAVFIWVQQSSNVWLEYSFYSLSKFKGEWILLILFSFTMRVEIFNFSPLEAFFSCADMHWNILPGLFSISLGMPLVLPAWVDNFTHSLLLLSLTIWHPLSILIYVLFAAGIGRDRFYFSCLPKFMLQSSVLGVKMDERAGCLLGNTFLLLWPLMLKELNTGSQGICS